MISIVADAGRLIVGTSGSPGSLAALRCARDVTRRNDVPLLALLARTPPAGDLAERHCASPGFRRLRADAARPRLNDALDAAWGVVPPDLGLQPVVIRGEPGPALVEIADSGDDLLVVGAGRGGKLTRMRRGKVSGYCLAHAQCRCWPSRSPLPPGRWASARPDGRCAWPPRTDPGPSSA
jgi:nucleotide-binding universal stress UspA family protein